MNVYLVAVPKKKSSIRDDEESYCSLIEKVASSYPLVVNTPEYYCFHEKIKGEPAPCQILIWDRFSPESFFSESDMSWAVSSGMQVSQVILEKVVRRKGELFYSEPVWGHYTVVRSESQMSQVQAWNTTPAIEAINYGEDESFVYISNRPLPIALALAGGDAKKIALNHDFVSEYLAFGYSVTGDSGFKDVFILSPNEVLVVNNGELKTKPFLAGLESKLSSVHSDEDAAQLLLSTLQSSMQRSVQSMRGEKIQLRMSGGKDSRLCAALAKPFCDKFYSVTFGKPGEPETSLASLISNRASIPIEITAPRLFESSTLRGKVELLLASSDGIMPSEPHTAIYRGANPRFEGEAVMMGQWPLFKGGYANRMRLSEKDVTDKLLSIAFPILTERARKRFDDYILNWSAQQEAQSHAEKLYLFSRQFRSGRWLQGSVALYSRDADVLYPISDAEVTSVSDALTLKDKVAQTALFKALDKLDDYFVKLPLSNSKWPAAAQELLNEKLSLSPALDVTEEMSKLGSPPNQVVVKSELSMRSPVVTEAAREVVSSSRYNQYLPILKDSFVLALEQAASGEMVAPEGMHIRTFKASVWRLFVVDTWLKKSWV